MRRRFRFRHAQSLTTLFEIREDTWRRFAKIFLPSSIMPGGKCLFQSEWCSKKEYKLWLAAGKDKHSAKCTACNREFSVAGMGESALRSHAKGSKHVSALGRKKENEPEPIPITQFLDLTREKSDVSFRCFLVFYLTVLSKTSKRHDLSAVLKLKVINRTCIF